MGRILEEFDSTSRAICEVLLRSYKDLDKAIERVARKSVIIGKFSRNRDVYEACAELIHLHNEQVAYINAKVAMERALNEVAHKDDLMLYYIDGIPMMTMAEKSGVKQCSIHQRIAWQKKRLFKSLLDFYTTAELIDFISDSSWLKAEFRRQKKILEKREKETAR